MSQWRNISDDARMVGYGCARRSVNPDEVLTVQDEVDVNYAGQVTIWAPASPRAEDAARAARPAEPEAISEPAPKPEPKPEPAVETAEPIEESK